MSSININNCNFYSNKIYKEKLRKILYETDISEINRNIINIKISLCQTYYNKLIFYKLSKIKQTKTYQHLKHKIYSNEIKLISKTNTYKSLIKILKRLIEVLELNEFAEIYNTICVKIKLIKIQNIYKMKNIKHQ